MKLTQRHACITEKYKYFTEEVFALRKEAVRYKIGFGILLVILFPVFVIEILIVILFGKDLGMFVSPKPILPPVLIEEEVPESLRELIPLARKYGIGDDGDRDDIMKAASPNELAELEEKIVARAQEIEDWLSTYPEDKISDTAAFFLYLGSACDEVPFYKSEEET